MTEQLLGMIRRPVRISICAAAPIITAAISAGCGIFVLAMTLRMVVLDWSPAPHTDQWDNLVTGRALSWSWLFAQHNEHRLFVPRLIYWLDRSLAAETNIVDFIFIFLIQGALCGLLTWLAAKASAANKTTIVFAGGLCLAVLFWALQFENFLLGMNVSFFAVILFAACAFAIVAVGPATVAGAAGAALMSGAAAYSLASGVVVAPLALLLGLWVRRPRWCILVLLLAAIGWPASYLWGYKTPGHHSDPADFLSNFVAVWTHFLIQVGAPVVTAVQNRPDLSKAAIVGAIGVFGFGASLLSLLLGTASAQQKSLAVLSAYLLVAAFLTALGRVRFGAEQAIASRYTTPVVAFWLSLWLIWFSMTRLKSGFRLLILVVGSFITMTAALSESYFLLAGRYNVARRDLALPALLAGIRDPNLTETYPDPDAVLEKRATLLQFHTSLFAQDWTRLMGANFADNFTVNADAHCEGSFQSVRPIDETGSDWSAVGAAWREESGEPLRRIVLTSDDGRIVGYGVGGFDSFWVDDQGLKLNGPAKPVWWTGDFRTANPARVRAYAVDDRAGACLIASNPRPAARPIALAPLPSPAPAPAGYIGLATVDGNIVRIYGWGDLSEGAGKVFVDTDLPVRWATMTRAPRPDVARALHDPSLQYSGIHVKLVLRDAARDQTRHRLCIWTEDPKFGRRTLPAPRIESLALVCDGAAAPPADKPAATINTGG